jgi:hypothetical protein
MKTIEWVLIIVGIALFIFLPFKFGNNTRNDIQFRTPSPHHNPVLLPPETIGSNIAM